MGSSLLQGFYSTGALGCPEAAQEVGWEKK